MRVFVAAAVILLLWALILVAFLALFGVAPKSFQNAALLIAGVLPLLVLALSVRKLTGRADRMSLIGVTLGGLALATALLAFGAFAPRWRSDAAPSSATVPTTKQPLELGGYEPTPQSAVDAMLELAGVTKDDVVYDLGCGDGRVVVTAAKKYGARAVGIDIDPQRVRESKANVQAAGVEELVEIRLGDAFDVVDLDRATVVTLFVLHDAMLKFREIFQEKLRPGTRVVSHHFSMDDWQPKEVRYIWDREGDSASLIFLWVIEDAAQSPEPVQVD